MNGVAKLRAELSEHLAAREPYDGLAKKINQYIMPGRTVNMLYSSGYKRKLYTTHSVNPAAEDASIVLTSGLQSGFVSESRPWFSLTFPDQKLKQVPQFTTWLYECQKVIYDILANSNFYSVIDPFFTEIANYGTCPLYVGERVSDSEPLLFNVLTWGEYCIAVNDMGRVDCIFRIAYKTNKQLVEEFGDKVPEYIRTYYREKGFSSDLYTVVKVVEKKPHLGMDYKGTWFLYDTPAKHGSPQAEKDAFEKPLKVAGFHEFPYPTGRWNIAGSDTYGMGIGHKVLQHVMRLQEVEKVFLMGIHKEADPPVNAPVNMKDQLDLMPGGTNWYSNPDAIVRKVFPEGFDVMGVAQSAGVVEQRIQKAYFNDVFLTGARDPNASPYKAREVDVREAEKTLRLGPAIGRMSSEVFRRVIQRVMAICYRRGLLPPAPDQLVEMDAQYDITMTGVLAQAQKAMAVKPITDFIQSAMMVGQLDPAAIDKVDTDAAMDELADVQGVPDKIQRPAEEVAKRRLARQQAAQQEAQAEKEAAAMAQNPQNAVAQTTAVKNMSEAGENFIDSLR